MGPANRSAAGRIGCGGAAAGEWLYHRIYLIVSKYDETWWIFSGGEKKTWPMLPRTLPGSWLAKEKPQIGRSLRRRRWNTGPVILGTIIMASPSDGLVQDGRGRNAAAWAVTSALTIHITKRFCLLPASF